MVYILCIKSDILNYFFVCLQTDKELQLQMTTTTATATATITCEHPVTGETLTFGASNVQVVDGSRSHHPVCVMEGGHLDDDDWFYRLIDNYDGPIVARYDRSYEPIWNEHKQKIVGVVLMSFEDWKKFSPRVCGDAKKPEYTFKTLKRQLAVELNTRS